MREKNRVEKDDLISRENVVEALYEAIRTDIRSTFTDSMSLAIAMAKNIPSAELKERTAKVSNQIFNNSNPYTVGAWMGTCECGELVSYSSKYCHMCGAKLDWGENG